MESSSHPSKAGEVLIRQAEPDDFPRLIELNSKAFPLLGEENVVWSVRQLSNHLKVFPAGQLVALIDGRIVGGGRLAGYAAMAAELTPEEYVQKVKDGELRDNVLSFQLREGFVVRGILRNYITDPVSLNHATLIEWLNPDYVETEASSKV